MCFFFFFGGGGGGGGGEGGGRGGQHDLKKSFLCCNMDGIYFNTTQNTCFDSRSVGFCIDLLKAQLV